MKFTDIIRFSHHESTLNCDAGKIFIVVRFTQWIERREDFRQLPSSFSNYQQRRKEHDGSQRSNPVFHFWNSDKYTKELIGRRFTISFLKWLVSKDCSVEGWRNILNISLSAGFGTSSNESTLPLIGLISSSILLEVWL